MKIDILKAPVVNINANRKKYTIIFLFFLGIACLSVGIAVYAIYFSTRYYQNLEDISLGILVGASLFITYFGEKLQAYKRLYPPHRKKLAELRQQHPAIDNYCGQVELLDREMIRAEFLACTRYAEKFPAEQPMPPVH